MENLDVNKEMAKKQKEVIRENIKDVG